MKGLLKINENVKPIIYVLIKTHISCNFIGDAYVKSKMMYPIKICNYGNKNINPHLIRTDAKRSVKMKTKVKEYERKF